MTMLALAIMSRGSRFCLIICAGMYAGVVAVHVIVPYGHVLKVRKKNNWKKYAIMKVQEFIFLVALCKSD